MQEGMEGVKEGMTEGTKERGEGRDDGRNIHVYTREGERID